MLRNLTIQAANPPLGSYCMSKKSWPFLYSIMVLQYWSTMYSMYYIIIGQDLLDILYYMHRQESNICYRYSRTLWSYLTRGLRPGLIYINPGWGHNPLKSKFSFSVSGYVRGRMNFIAIILLVKYWCSKLCKFPL